MLGSKPLPVTSIIRNWAQGEGIQIARSLELALQLLDDVKYFTSRTNEAFAIRLQWHTIAVLIPLHFLFFVILLQYSLYEH